MPDAPPTAPTKDRLVEQYELGDSSFDPAIHGMPAREAAAPAPKADPAPEPPKSARNPDGTFAKSDRLLREATEYQIDPAEAESMSSAELRQEIHQRRLERIWESKLSGLSDATAPRQPAPTAPAKSEDAPGIDWGEAGEDQYDPVLVRTVKLVHEQAQVIKALQDQVGQLHGLEQHRQQESFAQTVDRVFAAREDVFGKGRGHELPKESPEYARRTAALGYAAGLDPKLPVEERVGKAVALLFGAAKPEAKDAPKPHATRVSPEEWNAAQLARPTSRHPAELPPGPDRAKRKLAEVYRENGVGRGREEDDLPDV